MYNYDDIVAKAPCPTKVQWVFGYGSILFKQGFDAGQTQAGYIKGWKRVFHQLSTDHRGVPEQPGRTVTLAPNDAEVTWGIAYKLPDDIEERRAALQELEWREKQYDLKVYADIHDRDGNVVVAGALTYVGSSDPAANINWGGPAAAEELAMQIAHARGPSGPNYEYLYKLAEGLRALEVVDEHVFELEARVLAILGAAAAATPAA